MSEGDQVQPSDRLCVYDEANQTVVVLERLEGNQPLLPGDIGWREVSRTRVAPSATAGFASSASHVRPMRDPYKGS